MDELIEYLKSQNLNEIAILRVENMVKILISKEKIKLIETLKTETNEKI